MAFVRPDLDVESWNGITIGGDRCPGHISFPEYAIERKIDEKDSPGSQVFALTDKGPLCTKVTFAIHLFTQQDFTDFETFYRKHLDPRRPLKKQNVETVVHPSLYLNGIKQLYFSGANGIQPHRGGKGPVGKGGGMGSYVVPVRGMEFNEHTKIGDGGSKKVKLDLSKTVGKAGKWTNDNLKLSPPTPPKGANQGPNQTPASPTHDQIRSAAAAGDPDAKLVAAMMDFTAANP